MNDGIDYARPLHLGDEAPDFLARTTQGELRLSTFRGRWLVFFSHPADFTPVCTSEFAAFAKAYPRFEALGCALLGLSVDSLYSHFAWLNAIEAHLGVRVPFPVVEDPTMAIGRAYAMIDPDARDSACVRATYVIDPIGRIRAIVTYPMTVGRSINEILRLVAALQRAEIGDAAVPADWHPGDQVLRTAPTVADAATGNWFHDLRPDGVAAE